MVDHGGAGGSTDLGGAGNGGEQGKAGGMRKQGAMLNQRTKVVPKDPRWSWSED